MKKSWTGNYSIGSKAPTSYHSLARFDFLYPDSNDDKYARESKNVIAVQDLLETAEV